MQLKAKRATLTLVRLSPERHKAWAAAASAWITPNERNLAARIPDSATRVQHMIGRALIRRSGAHATGCAPRELTVNADCGGKPDLFGLDHFHVSVAHTGGAVVLATSPVPVGVDIEPLRSDSRPLRRLAQRLFTEHENAWLGLVPDDQLPGVFTRLWTIKEAVGKAVGSALPAAFSGVEVDFHEGALSLSQVTIGPPAPVWTLHQLTAPGGEEELAIALPHRGVALADTEILTLDEFSVS